MSRAPRAMARVVALLAIAMAVAALLLVLHYVPFEPTSYAAWAGITLAAVSALCLVRPPRVLGRRPRRCAGLGVAAGLVVAASAVLWPASVVRVAGSGQRLDDFLPQYQFREYHETTVEAPLERVAEAVRSVTFDDMPAAVWLMRVRALAGGHVATARPAPRPILDLMSRPGSGFMPLDLSNPNEVVYGMVGRPWAGERPPLVRNGEEFLAFAAPGQIRVAFNIRLVDEGSGRVRLSTETRTLGNDAAAQRIFARYWRLIYPGSAIIRRVWLDAIASRART